MKAVILAGGFGTRLAEETVRIPKPMVECGPADKVHPGPGFRQMEPCVHQARRSRDDD